MNKKILIANKIRHVGFSVGAMPILKIFKPWKLADKIIEKTWLFPVSGRIAKFSKSAI